MNNGQRKRILIAGGGTGGHVYPALATIEALKKKGEFDFLYVGGKNGIETRIVPKHAIAMETIWIAGIARSLSLKNLLFPLKLLASVAKSWGIIGRFKPHVAIGTGGYVSGPILFVASKRGVPVLIQEQDAHPGLTTRWLSKYARAICLAFPDAAKAFSDVAEKVRITGNPVRQDLGKIGVEAARKFWELSPDRLTMFIFGGSQGARSINQAMTKILPKLLESHDLQVIWQTGENQFGTVMKSIKTDSQRVKIMPYVQNMDAAYAAADLVICRAGALTLAELGIVQKPAILIPYPFAAGDHQVHNSRMVAAAGAAEMIQETEGWEQQLAGAIDRLLTDPEKRRQQGLAWQKLAKPDAANEIAEAALSLIKKS